MRSVFSAILATAYIAAAGGAMAQSYTVGKLKISQPWTRPTPPGAPAGAGYLTITNLGRTPDRLLGGSSPATTSVEVHQMSLIGGVMRMRPVVGGLSIPPTGTVTLAPGGYHLMLIGPVRPFKDGDHIHAKLQFEHAGSVDIEMSVQMTAPGGEPPASGERR